MENTFNVEEAREYCLHHPLSRPKVSIKGLIVKVILAEITVLAIAWVLHRLTLISFFIFEDWLNFIVLMIFAKPMCKTAIKIYQSKASEETRRRCHCMPSCSEYALLALDKYIWPKALWLIYRRLIHTCRKPGFKVDFP
jgi:putative component of membrane protein insertase Oxa1/YidC/SpoIIIJ protein YidD